MSENDGGGVLGEDSPLTADVSLSKRQTSQVDHLELGGNSIVNIENEPQHYVSVSSSVSQDSLSIENLDNSRINQHINSANITPLHHNVGPSNHSAYSAIEYVSSSVVDLQDDNSNKFAETLVPVNNVEFVEMNGASIKQNSGPPFEFYFGTLPTTSVNSSQIPQTTTTYLPRHEHQTPKAQLLVRAFSDFIQPQEQQQQNHQQQINVHMHSNDPVQSADHSESALPDVLDASFVHLDQSVIPHPLNDYRKSLKDSQKRLVPIQLYQKQLHNFSNNSLNVEHNQKLILEQSLQTQETLHSQQHVLSQDLLKEQSNFQASPPRYQLIHKQFNQPQRAVNITEYVVKDELLSSNIMIQYGEHIAKTTQSNVSGNKQTGKEVTEKNIHKTSELSHHMPMVSRSGRPIRRRPEYIEYVNQSLKDDQIQHINKSPLIKLESNHITYDDDEEIGEEEENDRLSNDEDHDHSGTYSSDGKKSLPHKKRIPKKLKNAKKHVKCYRCGQCNEQFINLSHFNQHKQMHSLSSIKQSKPFNCEICTKGCDSQLKFFEHLKSHYEPYKKHKCEVCGGEFGNIELLEEHSLVHSREHFKCNVCHKTFRKESMLEVHIKVAHLDEEDSSSVEKPYTCVVCPKSYRSQMALDAHVQSEHCDDPPELNCEDCYRVFKSKAKLLTHRKLEHKEEINHTRGTPKRKVRIGKSMSLGKSLNRGFPCNLCPRTFTHKNSLIYHIRGHTGERPHQCEHCGKAFFAAGALKVHLRLHSGEKPYKCEECGKFFRQWGDLRYHTSSVHSDARQFQCEFCGKDFKRKYCLVVHRRIHTGEKKYKCDYCLKSFRASSYLQNHKRIHTGERPYPCPDCGKPFRVRSDMKRHRNTHMRDIGGAASGAVSSTNTSAAPSSSGSTLSVAVHSGGSNTSLNVSQPPTIVTSQQHTIITRQNSHSQGQVQILQGSVTQGPMGQLIIAEGVPTVISDQNQPIRIMVSGLNQQPVSHGIHPPPAHRHSQVAAVSMGSMTPGSPCGASNLSTSTSSLTPEVIIMDESNSQPINLNILPRIMAHSGATSGQVSTSPEDEQQYELIPATRGSLEMREEGDVCVWSGVQVFTS